MITVERQDAALQQTNVGVKSMCVAFGGSTELNTAHQCRRVCGRAVFNILHTRAKGKINKKHTAVGFYFVSAHPRFHTPERIHLSQPPVWHLQHDHD